MKKICFLIGNINHSGGTERVTTLIANKLAIDNQIFILSLSCGDNPFFEQESTIINSSLFTEAISMKSHFVSAISKIRKYLIHNKIDTLIVVDSISCVFTVPACYGLKINHICWEHFNLKVNLGSRFRDIGRWMAANWCDSIITLTERDKGFWDERFNLGHSGKVIAIANPSPYELQDNQPSLEDKSILCVGRLTYQKGFDLLIPAWAKIFSQLPGWKVTIVGSGEDEQMLKKMAESLGVTESIIFAGQQKDMDQFYRKASFFCMSSRFEGLPMVLLEAQSYGLPIVAFDCDTGPSELVCVGTGMLIPKDNIPKLAKVILDMANMDTQTYEKMSSNAFISANAFSLDKIYLSWVKII